MKRLLIIGLLALLGTVAGGGLGCSKVGEDVPAPAASTPQENQGWTLTNDAGQMAYVMEQPFTYSGVFDETTSSPGWWLLDGIGNKVLRIPVSGTVAHSGNYDTWDFTVTATGGGYRAMGQGTGTTNAPYPDGNTIQGTLVGNVTSPLGTTPTNDTWTGDDYTVWPTSGAVVAVPVAKASPAVAEESHSMFRLGLVDRENPTEPRP
jgi:hypothetical protein